jgi:DNA-binding FadR family transcriptional regulator
MSVVTSARRAPKGPLKPQAAGTTAERVAQALVDHIRRNRLRAGAELPSELRTSQDLRVSRGIIREAYRSLSSAGIIHITNGRSPRVGHVTHHALTSILQHALWTDQASLVDLLEIRAAIEECAAGLAAVRRSSHDVSDLRRAVAEMRSAGAHAERYVRADLAFHDAIARAAGNPLFGVMGTALREAVSVSMYVSIRSRRSRRERNQIIVTHEELTDAVAAGRAEEARRIMVQHFTDAHILIKRVFDPARRKARERDGSSSKLDARSSK